MKILHWTVNAVVALVATACVDTVNSGGSIGLNGDDVPLIGDDAAIVEKDVPVVADDTGTVKPLLCYLDGDCKAFRDSCNEGVCRGGLCAYSPLPDEMPCDDGNACTTNTRCHTGVCFGQYVCFEMPRLPEFYAIPPYPLHEGR